MRTLTDIPVPRVLSWSHTAANRVGAEYIIMDHMAGVPLLQVWQHMRGEQHIQFIRNFGKLMSKMGSLAFPAYGSLYFSDTSLVSEPLSKIDLRNGFGIGPHCGTNFWDCSVSEAKYYQFAKPNRGPCKSMFAAQAMRKYGRCTLTKRLRERFRRIHSSAHRCRVCTHSRS